MSIPSSSPASPSVPVVGAAFVTAPPPTGIGAPSGFDFGAALTACAAVLDASAAGTPAAVPTAPFGSAATPSLSGPRMPVGVAPAPEDAEEGAGDDLPPAAKHAPLDEDTAPSVAMYFASAPVPPLPASAPVISIGTDDETADVMTTCERAVIPAPLGLPDGRGDKLKGPWNAPVPASPPTAPNSAPNGVGVGAGLAVRQDLGLPTTRPHDRDASDATWVTPGKSESPSVGEIVREIAPTVPQPAAATPGVLDPKGSITTGSARLPEAPAAPIQDSISVSANPAAAPAEGALRPSAPASGLFLQPPAVRQPGQEKNAGLPPVITSIARTAAAPTDAPVANDGSLAVDGESVNPRPLTVGIAGASSSNAMRKSTESAVLQPAGHTRDSAIVIGVREVAVALPAQDSAFSPTHAAASDTPVASAGTPANAVAAIEATVDALNHARLAGRSSVDLKLTFADSTQLSVRVELRDGAVHTIFRTDSPELRDVLAREWTASAPALAAASRDHPLRIADPVFDRATPGFLSLGSSTGGQSQPREMPSPDSAAAHPRATTAREETPPSQAPAAPRSPNPHGSTLLNTFA